MEIEGFKVECSHEHVFMIEILVDKYSLTEDKIKTEDDEEEEEEEEDDDEEGEKVLIQKRDPADNRQMALTVQYFNLDQLERYATYVANNFDDLFFTKKLQMAEESTLNDEKAKADEETEADDGGKEDGKSKRKKNKSTGEDVAGTMAPGHKYYGGKSCLFPMKPTELIQQIVQASLVVTLYWKEDLNSPRKLIGDADVKLGKNFIKCVAEIHGVMPNSTFIEDTFKVKNNGENAGFVRLFVRLTNFGKTAYQFF